MSKRFLKNYAILLDKKNSNEKYKIPFFKKPIILEKSHRMCKSAIKLAFPQGVDENVKRHNFS